MNAPLVGDEFRRGFRRQENWGWSMAAAFFFGEAGAGLFLVSLFFDSVPGLALGLALTSVGKTAGHIVHLGRPSRAWRAILRLDRSWISRGLLAIIVFTGCGVVYTLQLAHADFGLVPAAAHPILGVLAAIAAVVIMLYQGLAMSHSPAIALWSTGLMPVIGLAYAMVAGVALALVLRMAPEAAQTLRTLEIGLIGYVLVMHLSLVHAAWHGAAGARKSAQLMLRGEFAMSYLGIVIVVGLAAPGVLFAIGRADADLAALPCVLAGYFAFRVVIFKAGVYDPPQQFSARLRRLG